MRHARRHTRTKTPKRVLALPDLEQARDRRSSAARDTNHDLSLLRWGCTTAARCGC